LRDARIPLSRRRAPADELPPAAIDAADAGERLRRRRPRARCLRARDLPTLPLLQLWGRDAGRAFRPLNDATPAFLRHSSPARTERRWSPRRGPREPSATPSRYASRTP